MGKLKRTALLALFFYLLWLGVPEANGPVMLSLEVCADKWKAVRFRDLTPARPPHAGLDILMDPSAGNDGPKAILRNVVVNPASNYPTISNTGLDPVVITITKEHVVPIIAVDLLVRRGTD